MKPIYIKNALAILTCALGLVVQGDSVFAAENKESKSPKEVIANNSMTADAFVQSISDNVMNLLHSSKSDSEKEKDLTKIFEDTVDIEWIAKFVIGKYWNEITPEQKAEYLTVYREYLIKSYVPMFKKYNNQEILIKNIDSGANSQYSVKTEIKSKEKNEAYTVEYKLKTKDNTYKVRDIIAEGVSLLSTQRSEFGSIIGSEGIEGLSKKLKEKIELT
jgi:phospholipid transport system substrate-binding protein